MSQEQSLQRHLIALGAISLICLISITAYITRSNSFALATTPESFHPVMTNGYILQSQMPADVYTYTVARLDDYLRANNLPASSLNIRGGLATDPSTYDFAVVTVPEGQVLNVRVEVTNFSPILSTAVLVNGQLQNPLAPGQAQSDALNSAQVSGMDDLVNAGLTSLQATSLQAALQKFAPSASSITIDPSSITHLPIDSRGSTAIIGYAFTVKIDSKSYHADLRCSSLSSAQLILTDQGGKQVFDSGTITSD